MIGHLKWIGLIVTTLLTLAQAKQVSCVGDSITYGYGLTDRAHDSYPVQLERLLRAVDSTWRVSNFGVNSKTLLHRGDQPYIQTSAYQQALASKPDIVIIMLGTNDAKPQNWVYKADFVSDYCNLIDSFQTLPTGPEVWICKPVPAFDNPYTISPTVVNQEIPPLIDQIAAIKGTPVIDLYHPLLDHGNLFPDGIHPNAEGAGIMAQTIAPLLLGVNKSADFNGDGRVNLLDLAILAQSWLQDSNTLDLAPVPNGDGLVSMPDLMGLSRIWLTYPGILAHWPLDESEGTIAVDTAGDANGVLHGDPQWQPDGGVLAGALSLDGLDDYVNLGRVMNPHDGPFTLFVWVQGGGPNQIILCQSSSARNTTTLLGTNASGALMTAATDGGRATQDLDSDTVITDGHWHRVRLVWDGALRSLYVDGHQVARDTQPLGSMRGSTVPLLLGTGGQKTPGTFWQGLIDDVRIHDVAIFPGD